MTIVDHFKGFGMETINAREAKQGFGEVLMKAQKEPVCINKNGKPTAYMISVDEFEGFQAYRTELLHKKLDEGLADIKAGRVVDGPEFMEKMRKKYFDGNV